MPVYSEHEFTAIKNDPENPAYEFVFDALDAYNAEVYGSRKIPYDEAL